MKKWTMYLVAVFLVMGISVGHAQILKLDFNSTNQDGGPHNQEGWSAYDAGHEVAADFVTKDYDGITVTPAWPNTTDNRVQQMIDRGAGNDNQWMNDAGDLDLVTDFLGIDTRTGNGGNGNWDGTTGTPTYMTLAIGGLAAGKYEWTSFHHDTENVFGDFSVEISTDGGLTFIQLDDGLMTDSSTGGSPDSEGEGYEDYTREVGPDVYSLPSTYKLTFTANGTDDVVMRFAPYAEVNVHKQIWGINGLVIDIPADRKAHDPVVSPADENGIVSPTGPVTLEWKTGLTINPADPNVDIVNPAIEAHYLYISDGSGDPNLNYAAKIDAVGDGASFSLSDLGTDKNFIWTVEEAVSNGQGGIYPPGDPNNIFGPIWTFATPVSFPIVNTQPVNTSALPGETAVFEIDASSILPLTYTWYYSVDNIIDGSDTVVHEGIDESVLSIDLDADTATAIANSQGYYYCILDNGNVTESDVVFLLVNRIIAQYSFEGNTKDSSIEGNDGIWTDPAVEAYSTGVIGTGSVVLSAADSNSIDVGLNAVPSSDPAIGGVQEGSAAYWIKTTNTGFQSIYGSFNTEDNTGFHLNINEASSNGQVEVYIRGGSGTTELDAILGIDSVLFDGNWHHLAFTWSASANEGVVYFDGVPVATEGVNAAVMTPWEYPPTIGSRNLRGVLNGFVDGELDELLFYNYSLPKEDVYNLYLDGPADWVCDEQPELDWDGNCVVDLGDFATFAEKWLECGRYPDEECK